MAKREFGELLSQQNLQYQKYTCVGLDTNNNLVPKTGELGLMNRVHVERANFQLAYNEILVDATHNLVGVYKPNLAFYVALGQQGIRSLKRTIEYIYNQAPQVPVVLDAKFGDIDSTNDGYAEFAFDYLKADAVTVHNYLGPEAMKPFLARKDKGVLVLVRTSNKGGGRFQDLAIDIDRDLPLDHPEGTIVGARHGGTWLESLFVQVARSVVKEWNYNGNCGVVAGATYPTEAGIARQIVGPNMPILVPGVSVQGGRAKDIVPLALRKGELGMINSSRGIIFATRLENETIADAAYRSLSKLHQEIMTAQQIFLT